MTEVYDTSVIAFYVYYVVAISLIGYGRDHLQTANEKMFAASSLRREPRR